MRGRARWGKAVAMLGWGLLTASSVCASDPPPASPAPSATGADAGPRLTVERETLDLGDIPRGGKAEASFVLRNEGSGVLRVLSAKPG